jgi:tetratricopeptide (TPR) repeat protein
MAKQRPQSKTKTQTASRSARPRPARSGAASSEKAPGAATTAPPAPVRTSYLEAVAVYERGIDALQRHDYQAALDLLRSVLDRFPEERELQERVRLYMNVCERHAAPREAAPQTVDERLYASTLALNRGRYDQAISHLRLVRDEDPDNDYALYMLAVAHAQRGDHLEAMAHLERAIALNAENRSLARQDPDLEPLRDDEAFQAMLDQSSGGARSDRRRPSRPFKSAR